MRRGLTLIEVLASTLLLAVLAAAVVPLIQHALRSLNQSSPVYDDLQVDLTMFADALLNEPSQHGLPSIAELIEAGQTTLDWSQSFSGETSHPPIVARILKSDQQRVQHAWLILQFSPDGTFTSRWIALPTTPVATPATAQGARR